MHVLASRLMNFLPGKFDASDVVQETLLRHAHRASFEAKRRRMAPGCGKSGECRLERVRDQGRNPDSGSPGKSSRLEAWLAAEHITERKSARTPDQHRRLREVATTSEPLRQHLQEPAWTLTQIAEHLNRPSARAVAGLLARGLEKLREVLREPQ